MVFLHAVEGVISILIMVAVGYALTWKGWFNSETAKLIPKLVNYVALPPYMLWSLMNTFDKGKLEHMIYGMAVPLLSMAITFIIGVGISILLKVPPGRKGTFRAVYFASSAVFVGVPVNAALFGESSIQYVLLYFLANALMFWTIGNYSISTDGQGPPAKILSLTTLKNIFSAPLVGFLFAITLILLEIRVPDFLFNTAKSLGGMTTPLSLMFIGIVMFSVDLKKLRLTKDLIAVLFGRFVVSPVAVLLVASFFPLPELMKKVFVIQAALPAISQTTLMTSFYGGDSEYAATLVSLTTLVSMLAIPIYMCLI